MVRDAAEHHRHTEKILLVARFLSPCRRSAEPASCDTAACAAVRKSPSRPCSTPAEDHSAGSRKSSSRQCDHSSFSLLQWPAASTDALPLAPRHVAASDCRSTRQKPWLPSPRSTAPAVFLSSDANQSLWPEHKRGHSRPSRSSCWPSIHSLHGSLLGVSESAGSLSSLLYAKRSSFDLCTQTSHGR